MILEGIKLMFVGMTTVVLFLTLMIFLIQLVSRLTKGATERELEAIRLERELLARSKKEKRSQEGGEDDIAAIAAAVAAYEAERFAIG
jgi:sodium pump decarboxylase gamma subunit